MLNLLVEMGAIDKDLWECDKIIWSQNLVDNVTEVYRNRRRELPCKPISTGRKLLTTGRACIVCGKAMDSMRTDAKYCSDNCRLQGFRETDNETDNETDKNLSTKDNGITMSVNPLTTPDNPITTSQSKVKESKVKQNKLKETIITVAPSLNSLEHVIEVYKQNIALDDVLTETMENELTLAAERFSAPWVLDAIREACLQNNKTWRYIAGILKNWERYGKPDSC